LPVTIAKNSDTEGEIMRKMTVKPRKSRLKISVFDDGIRDDDERRLRNALFAMANMDPSWMWWVEKNIPKWEGLTWKRRMIERQARILSAKHYCFLGWGYQLSVIYSDYYFTDDGHLKTYL
jgi:hypothetical protein